MKFQGFKWTEFRPSLYECGEMVLIKDIPEEREKYGKERPMFTSRYLFDRPFPYTGKVLSNFYADFDDEEDPQRALIEGLDMAEQFVNIGVEETHIKLRFTGGKGCSVEVPYQYFKVKPRADLPQIWKGIAKWFAKNWHYKTLDTSVYDRRRAWRLTNTRHKSGRFKIPVTIQDLKDNKLEGIKELAKKPIPYDWVDDRSVEVNPITKLVELYKDIRKEVVTESRKFKKTLKEKIVFDGRIFPCVESLIKGGVDAEEFQRNPTAFRMAVSLISLEIDEEQILDYLEEFAESCTPPLPFERYPELEHCIEMAKKHEYVTHCGTPCFEAVCVGKKKCWVFSDEDTPAELDFIETFDEATHNAAEEFLNGDSQLERIEYALSEIVEERDLKVSATLLQLIGENFQVTGPSSSGKTYIVKTVLLLFPAHLWVKISGQSDKMLRYAGDLIEDKTIFLEEWRALGKAKDEPTGVYDIKLGMSEGEITAWVTVKDKESGKYSVQVSKSRIRNVIATTTNVDMDIEVENRMWELNTNLDINEDVVRFQMSQDELPPVGRINREHEQKVIRCAVDKIVNECPTRYILPYATQLWKILEPFMGQERIRRDYPKLRQAIRASAMLHYRKRPIIEDAEGQFLVCMPSDLYWTMQYMRETIFGTLAERGKWAERWLTTINEIMNSGKRLDASTLANATGRHVRRARDWLDRFKQEGLLIESGRDSKGIFYTSASGDKNIGYKDIVISLSHLTEYTALKLSSFLSPEEFKRSSAKLLDVERQRFSDDEKLSLRLPVKGQSKIEDLPDAPYQITPTGPIDITRMTAEQLKHDPLRNWSIILRGRRFFRCPKCRHRLYMEHYDNDLHCRNCGHTEIVEWPGGES